MNTFILKLILQMKIILTEKVVRFDSKVAMNVNSVAEIMKKNVSFNQIIAGRHILYAD